MVVPKRDTRKVFINADPKKDKIKFIALKENLITVEMLLKKSYSQKAWVWGFRKSLRVEFYSDNTTETSLILKSNKIMPK